MKKTIKELIDEMNGVRVTERKPMSAKEQRDVYNKALIHRALKEGSKQ